MQPREKMYHIGLTKEDVEGIHYAILPGDPGRVKKIAALMDNPRKLAQNREYTSAIAEIDGQKVLVISTGIGGPSASIAAEELCKIGVTNLIRIGTCGGMQLDVKAGDVVIVSGAVRQEGTSKEYAPIEFPAIADLDITLALREAAKDLGFNYHTGIVQCKDSFYGQHDPSTMPVSYELENKWQAWLRCGVLASEMETAALYTVSSVRGAKAGAVMLCVWNQEREKQGLSQDEFHDTERAIRVVIEGIRKLMKKQ